MIETTVVYRHLQTAYDRGFKQVSARGGSRSGKTYNIVIWLIVFCLLHPGTTVSIVRKTGPSLRGSVLRDVDEILSRMAVATTYNKTELIFTFTNGSWIELFSTDNETKLRGRKRKILFINEANELSYMEYQQLKFRTEDFTICDYNPSITEDHWLYEFDKDERTFMYVTTYRDNYRFLSPVIIQEIESLKTKNKSLWQIYGLGQMAVIEGLVFANNVKIVDTVPEHIRRRWYGMDLGFTADPTAIVEVAQEGNNLYIDEKCYLTQMLSSDIIRAFKALPPLKIISESADPRLVQEIYRAGLDIHPVQKFPGSVEAGITKMQEFKLCITRRSTNTIRESKNYVWAQDKDGKWLNKPIDLFNHSMDAIRYVVLEEILGANRKLIDKDRLSKIVY